MIEVISILALLTSMLLLIVHYRNQIERRHGEITHLRTDFLRSLAAIHQRYISIQMNLEIARIELRHIPDSEDKYESIESMPNLIGKTKEGVQRVSEIKNKLECMDTTKLKKGKTLLMLQSIENSVRSIEDSTSSLEQNTLSFLEDIRIIYERGEK